MSSMVSPRSGWSTALVSFFTGPFGGFLWIGRGWLAVLAAAIQLVLGAYLIFFAEFPVLPEAMRFGEATTLLLSLAVGIASVAIVLPFRKTGRPGKWYSHGLFVFAAAYLFLALGTALLVRTFVLQPFSMPSTAMLPTLVEGDYFFVSKAAYGYSRFSAPFDLLPVEGRIFAAQPERGDIVVFRVPANPAVSYVMRIVGLPRETIQMIDGHLHIDGMPVRLETIGEYEIDNPGSSQPAELQREILPNGASYEVLNLRDDSFSDNTDPQVVPEDHYFVLGDNRDNSKDSRFQTGYIPFENLVGRAERIFWNSEGREFSGRSHLIPLRSAGAK